jgi:Secretion system C-terminal sorting domain
MLVAYPNPTRGILKIKVQNTSLVDQDLSIISSQGVLMSSEKLWRAETMAEKEYNVANWAPGIYLIKVSSPYKTLVRKVVVLK